MSAVAATDVPRGTDAFGGLIRTGETPEHALRRLEKSAKYSQLIGTDEGQRLLAAATEQVEAQPNGGMRSHKEVARLTARGMDLEARELERALASDEAAAGGLPAQSIAQIPIASIDIGTNVRVNVAEFDELTASIQTHGVLQPIKVRPAGDRFTIVWGQRRFLASRQAGLEAIPALVDVAEKTAPVLAIEQLVENLHRADLPPLDRARAMRAVVDAGMSQAALAKELGLAPSTISNDLGLLEVAEPVAELIAAGTLTPSHVKPLKGLAPSTQIELAKRAVQQRTTSHDMEDLVRRHKESEEWRKRQEAREREEAKASATRLEGQLANLAKKKVRLDADVRVGSSYGGSAGTRGHAIAERIRKLGYTNVSEDRGAASRGQAIGCDCKVWKVSVEYDRISIVPGCDNTKHQRAKTAADEDKRQAKYSTERAVQKRLAEIGAAQVAASPLGTDRPIHLSTLVARMALWQAMDYRAADWAEKHGGKRSNPWAVIAALGDEQLAAELGSALAEGFRDHYGYHIDWTSLADELGITDQAAAAAAS